MHRSWKPNFLLRAIFVSRRTAYRAASERTDAHPKVATMWQQKVAGVVCCQFVAKPPFYPLNYGDNWLWMTCDERVLKITSVLPKVLLCLFLFEAVHRRSNSLKPFHLQFRLGSFQTHGKRGTGWNSGSIAAQDFLKDGWMRFNSDWILPSYTWFLAFDLR